VRVVAVALVVLCVSGLALARYPSAVRGLNNRAAHNAQLSATGRELELADTLGISRPFVLAAQRLVPKGSSFTVVTGPNARARSSLTLTGLGAYLQNLLMPRTALEGGGAWLLCYGCDLGKAGPVDVVWRQGGLVIGRRSG
jgi:hypothetical protein